jgi:hypothetical protein
MSLTRIHNLSISLDGFATGEPQSADAPFGHAGERLHEWMFGTRFWDTGGTAGVDDAFAERHSYGIGAEIAFGIAAQRDDVLVVWYSWFTFLKLEMIDVSLITCCARPSVRVVLTCPSCIKIIPFAIAHKSQPETIIGSASYILPIRTRIRTINTTYPIPPEGLAVRSVPFRSKASLFRHRRKCSAREYPCCSRSCV